MIHFFSPFFWAKVHHLAKMLRYGSSHQWKNFCLQFEEDVFKIPFNYYVIVLFIRFEKNKQEKDKLAK